MVNYSNTRPSTSLRQLCEEAAARGISPETCLQGTSVKLSDLRDVNALHSTEDEIRIIENFVRAAPENVGLGYAVGRSVHVNAFGIWGFAMLTSPTLRSAIETSIQYIKLSSVIAESSFKEENGTVWVSYDISGLPEITHRYILERHIVIAVKFIRTLLHQHDYSDFEVWVTEGDEAYPGKMAELGSIPIILNRPTNALVFSADILDIPLPKSDPVSLKFCLDQCKALLEEQTGTLPEWSQRVRNVVVDKIGEELQIETVANELGVTQRTLRRRLTEEGFSFRDIYIKARMTIAYELLSSAGLNVETVSWRIGYSEPSSFARVFTKFFNQSPGEVRKKHRHRVS